MFKKIALLPLTLILLTACSGRSTLPSSVSYNSMSAGSRSSSRASTTVNSQSADSSAGSRLSARQTGMQDSGGINYGNAERTANREAQIDNGSMVDDSSKNNPDTRSSEKANARCGGGYDESLLCNGAGGASQ